MSDIPTTEPQSVTAGDTVSWQITLADYPASAGWALSYALQSSTSKITIPTVAAGDDHLVSVAPAASILWAAGTYNWQGSVSNGTSRYTVRSGRLTILADLATSTPAKTTARQLLEAVEAALLGTGTLTQRMMEINGKRLERHNPAELLTMRSKLMQEVAAEDQAARVAAGLDSGNTLRVRFQ